MIISNCVINLSADKGRVLSEAFRVLRPGGRLAVSDVIRRGDALPEAIARNIELWIGCVAGALEENEYKRLLAEAGFTEISIEPTRIYRVDDARDFLSAAGIASESLPADSFAPGSKRLCGENSPFPTEAQRGLSPATQRDVFDSDRKTFDQERRRRRHGD